MNMKKKPSGYYWRIVNKIKRKFQDNQNLFLEDFPPKAQLIIIHASFKYLPLIIINTTRPKERKKKKSVVAQ